MYKLITYEYIYKQSIPYEAIYGLLMTNEILFGSSGCVGNESACGRVFHAGQV